MTAVRIVARLIDAPFAVIVHGTRAWRAVTRARCPLCRERSRYMDAHLTIDHFGETA